MSLFCLVWLSLLIISFVASMTLYSLGSRIKLCLALFLVRAEVIELFLVFGVFEVRLYLLGARVFFAQVQLHLTFHPFESVALITGSISGFLIACHYPLAFHQVKHLLIGSCCTSVSHRSLARATFFSFRLPCYAKCGISHHCKKFSIFQQLRRWCLPAENP